MAATLVSKEYVGNSLLKKYKWTMPSVEASGSSNETELAIDQPNGDLQGVDIIAAGSTSFTISIDQKTGITTYGTDRIYYRNGISYYIKEMGLICPFENADTVQANKLYITIDNDDGGNATETIEVNLYIRER